MKKNKESERRYFKVKKERLKVFEKLYSEIKAMNDSEEDEWIEFIEENNLEDELDYVPNERIKEKDCPLCSLKEISKYTKTSYLLTKLGMTEQEIEQEIKNNFSDLKELQSYFKKPLN